jgi:hypothetical protein
MESAMGDVTRNDLDTMRDRIESLVREGFVGVHSRLDKLNGRTGATEVNVADIKPRLAHVEREMGEVREGLSGMGESFRAGLSAMRTEVLGVAGTVKQDAKNVKTEESGENRRITSRDVMLVLGTIGLLLSALAFLGKLQP